MSTNDGPEFSVEEAAEKLRAIKSSAGSDTLREFFQTGGGLLDFEQSDLVAAVQVVGRDRAQQILDVDVPSELPGEQVTLAGKPEPRRVPEERAEPPPRGTASLAEFRPGDDEPDESTGEAVCDEQREQVERVLTSARRQNILDAGQFNQAVEAAQREGCLSREDASRLQVRARGLPLEPSRMDFDFLLEAVLEAFAGGPGNG